MDKKLLSENHEKENCSFSSDQTKEASKTTKQSSSDVQSSTLIARMQHDTAPSDGAVGRNGDIDVRDSRLNDSDTKLKDSKILVTDKVPEMLRIEKDVQQSILKSPIDSQRERKPDTVKVSTIQFAEIPTDVVANQRISRDTGDIKSDLQRSSTVPEISLHKEIVEEVDTVSTTYFDLTQLSLEGDGSPLSLLDWNSDKLTLYRNKTEVRSVGDLCLHSTEQSENGKEKNGEEKDVFDSPKEDLKFMTTTSVDTVNKSGENETSKHLPSTTVISDKTQQDVSPSHVAISFKDEHTIKTEKVVPVDMKQTINNISPPSSVLQKEETKIDNLLTNIHKQDDNISKEISIDSNAKLEKECIQTQDIQLLPLKVEDNKSVTTNVSTTKEDKLHKIDEMVDDMEECMDTIFLKMSIPKKKEVIESESTSKTEDTGSQISLEKELKLTSAESPTCREKMTNSSVVGDTTVLENKHFLEETVVPVSNVQSKKDKENLVPKTLKETEYAQSQPIINETQVPKPMKDEKIDISEIQISKEIDNSQSINKVYFITDSSPPVNTENLQSADVKEIPQRSSFYRCKDITLPQKAVQEKESTKFDSVKEISSQSVIFQSSDFENKVRKDQSEQPMELLSTDSTEIKEAVLQKSISKDIENKLSFTASNEKETQIDNPKDEKISSLCESKESENLYSNLTKDKEKSICPSFIAKDNIQETRTTISKDKMSIASSSTLNGNETETTHSNITKHEEIISSTNISKEKELSKLQQNEIKELVTSPNISIYSCTTSEDKKILPSIESAEKIHYISKDKDTSLPIVLKEKEIPLKISEGKENNKIVTDTCISSEDNEQQKIQLNISKSEEISIIKEKELNLQSTNPKHEKSLPSKDEKRKPDGVKLENQAIESIPQENKEMKAESIKSQEKDKDLLPKEKELKIESGTRLEKDTEQSLLKDKELNDISDKPSEIDKKSLPLKNQKLKTELSASQEKSKESASQKESEFKIEHVKLQDKEKELSLSKDKESKTEIIDIQEKTKETLPSKDEQIKSVSAELQKKEYELLTSKNTELKMNHNEPLKKVEESLPSKEKESKIEPIKLPEKSKGKVSLPKEKDLKTDVDESVAKVKESLTPEKSKEVSLSKDKELTFEPAKLQEIEKESLASKNVEPKKDLGKPLEKAEELLPSKEKNSKTETIQEKDKITLLLTDKKLKTDLNEPVEKVKESLPSKVKESKTEPVNLQGKDEEISLPKDKELETETAKPLENNKELKTDKQLGKDMEQLSVNNKEVKTESVKLQEKSKEILPSKDKELKSEHINLQEKEKESLISKPQGNIKESLPSNITDVKTEHIKIQDKSKETSPSINKKLKSEDVKVQKKEESLPSNEELKINLGEPLKIIKESASPKDIGSKIHHMQKEEKESLSSNTIELKSESNKPIITDKESLRTNDKKLGTESDKVQKKGMESLKSNDIESVKPPEKDKEPFLSKEKEVKTELDKALGKNKESFIINDAAVKIESIKLQEKDKEIVLSKEKELKSESVKLQETEKELLLSKNLELKIEPEKVLEKDKNLSQDKDLKTEPIKQEEKDRELMISEDKESESSSILSTEKLEDSRITIPKYTVPLSALSTKDKKLEKSQPAITMDKDILSVSVTKENEIENFKSETSEDKAMPIEILKNKELKNESVTKEMEKLQNNVLKENDVSLEKPSTTVMNEKELERLPSITSVEKKVVLLHSSNAKEGKLPEIPSNVCEQTTKGKYILSNAKDAGQESSSRKQKSSSTIRPLPTVGQSPTHSVPENDVSKLDSISVIETKSDAISTADISSIDSEIKTTQSSTTTTQEQQVTVSSDILSSRVKDNVDTKERPTEVPQENVFKSKQDNLKTDKLKVSKTDEENGAKAYDTDNSKTLPPAVNGIVSHLLPSNKIQDIEQFEKEAVLEQSQLKENEKEKQLVSQLESSIDEIEKGTEILESDSDFLVMDTNNSEKLDSKLEKKEITIEGPTDQLIKKLVDTEDKQIDIKKVEDNQIEHSEDENLKESQKNKTMPSPKKLVESKSPKETSPVKEEKRKRRKIKRRDVKERTATPELKKDSEKSADEQEINEKTPKSPVKKRIVRNHRSLTRRDSPSTPDSTKAPPSPSKRPYGTSSQSSPKKTPYSRNESSPIKASVGFAPNPNLKNVKSKVGSFDNIHYKPKGGDKKVFSMKKLEWHAVAKIKSLENASYKPGGGDKKIISLKLDFKEKAQPKHTDSESDTEAIETLKGDKKFSEKDNNETSDEAQAAAEQEAAEAAEETSNQEEVAA